MKIIALALFAASAIASSAFAGGRWQESFDEYQRELQIENEFQAQDWALQQQQDALEEINSKLDALQEIQNRLNEIDDQ